MTEETTSRVLERLRHMRGQLGRVEEKVDTLIIRVGERSRQRRGSEFGTRSRQNSSRPHRAAV